MDNLHENAASLASDIQVGGIVPAILLSNRPVDAVIFFIFFATMLFSMRIDRRSPYTLIVVFVFSMIFCFSVIGGFSESMVLSIFCRGVLGVSFLLFVACLLPVSQWHRAKLSRSYIDKDTMFSGNLIYSIAYGVPLLFVVSVSVVAYSMNGDSELLILSIIVAISVATMGFLINVLAIKPYCEVVISMLSRVESAVNKTFRGE